jgi:hypothetical protein
MNLKSIATTLTASLVLGFTFFGASAGATPNNSTCDLSGAGTSANPYLVNSQANLLELVDCDGAGSHFLQTADISVVGDWTPLASTTSPFVGVYDGGDKSISGVRITTFDTNPTVGGNNQYLGGLGLFVAVRNAHVKHLELDVVVDITSGVAGAAGVENFGAVAGWADASVFESLSTSLSVRITSGATGMARVGGVVGRVQSNLGAFNGTGSQGARFLDVHAYLDIKSDASNVAGLVPVVHLADPSGVVVVSQSSVILKSSATARVDGPNSAGLVGSIEKGRALIEDSFVRAEFNLRASNTTRVGGLIGFVITSTRPSITNSYAVASFPNFVSQTAISPLIAQSAASQEPRMTSVFWDSTVSSASSTLGTSKSTVQLKESSLFSSGGWDIAVGYDAQKIWGIHPTVNDGYPFLTSRFAQSPIPTPPTYTGAVTFSVQEGSAVVTTLTSTPSAVWELSSDPSGLMTVNPASGALTISSLAPVGTYQITVKFTGTNGAFDTQALSVVVTALPQQSTPPSPQQSQNPGSGVLKVTEVSSFSSRSISSQGGDITAYGRRLEGVTQLRLGGVVAKITENSAETLTFEIGPMQVGTWDLELVNGYGKLTILSAIEVKAPQVIVEVMPEAPIKGTLIGSRWSTVFLGNSRVLNPAQVAGIRAVQQQFADAKTVVCYGYTTNRSPNAWATNHALSRATAVCEGLKKLNPGLRTQVRLRFGESKSFAMRSSMQFWK